MMRFKSVVGSFFAIIVVMAIGAVLIWAFIQRRKELAAEQAGEHPVEAPSRVSVQDGKSIITLDKATQEKGGILVAPLEPLSYREEIQAYGTVVELQDLIELRKNYATAKAERDKANVSLNLSRKSYDRVKQLYENEQNMSAKRLEAAEATLRSDEADVHAAQEVLSALESAARQRWGMVLAEWLMTSSPALSRLLQQEDVLIQVTFPPGTEISSAPRTALIQATDGTIISANFVSPSPRTDPHLQGMTFFYTAPAQGATLLSGMNVLCYLPVGPEAQGVLVPEPAAVWWHGKAWVYVQKAPEQFVRTEVPTKNPVKDGWFVAKGFSAGEPIVVKGAQLFLSEEFRAQVQVGKD